MLTIAETWAKDPENTKTEAVQRQLEQLELQARKKLMDAKHAISIAENDRDSYIAQLKASGNPCYSNIEQHVEAVKEAVSNYAQAVSTFNSLFVNQQEGEA